MDLAFLLGTAAVISGGILGAVIRSWSLSRSLYSLEDRLTLVEGILQREVKTRAATERWRRPIKDEEAIAAALAHQPAPSKKVPWWDNPDLKRGAYVPK